MFAQDAADRAGLRAGGRERGRIGVERGLAQEHHDAAVDGALPEVDVRLADVALQARIAELVGDGAGIGVDHGTKAALCAGGDRGNFFVSLELDKHRFGKRRPGQAQERADQETDGGAFHGSGLDNGPMGRE